MRPRSPRVQRWLKRHPRFRRHFISTSSSWRNLVERWFRDLTPQRIRRGVFPSVEQLTAEIENYIEHHNHTAEGTTWTATAAADILENCRRLGSSG